jgi:ferredoxin-type protein NapH
VVLALTMGLFALQYARVPWLPGGLTGSSVAGRLQFLDPFALVETGVAARGLTASALLAALPLVLLYALLGRTFCGWMCPMEFLFAVTDRLKRSSARYGRRHGVPPAPLPAAARHVVLVALLGVSLALGVPLFTRYLSHLTNVFRAIGGGVAWAWALPVEPSVPLVSLGVIAALLVLELVLPRLWCRRLCPVGTVYGFFNWTSILAVRVDGAACVRCGKCEQACPAGIPIMASIDRGRLREPDCLRCGACVDACDGVRGAIALGVRRHA